MPLMLRTQPMSDRETFRVRYTHNMRYDLRRIGIPPGHLTDDAVLLLWVSRAPCLRCGFQTCSCEGGPIRPRPRSR